LSALWYYFAGVGRLAGLTGDHSWYIDTLGRMGPTYGEMTEKNCGGWIAALQGKDKVVGILARRTQGIVSHKLSIPDQTDGIQVIGTWMSRSAVDWNGTDIRHMANREILAGNIFHLDALLVLKDGTGWEGIDELRKQYAAPPVIEIERWTISGVATD
jgi:hypothetical protein